MRYVRVAIGVLAALGLAVPAPVVSALAEEPQSPARTVLPAALDIESKPTAVVVRIEGGFHPENRWLWYERDGTARFEGILSERRGRFRSHVDYAKVEKVIADAELCTRGDTLVRPAGNDVFTFHVSVLCGGAWRHFTTYEVFTPRKNEQVRDAVRELEKLASTLKWKPTDETVPPPDFGRPFRPIAANAAP